MPIPIFGAFSDCFCVFSDILAPRERLLALSSLRHTNLTRRIDPRHPGTSEILHPQKNMNSEFPKKLSYSSRNAYIQKLRARLLGKASRLLKNLKNT